jgi:manganese efflux pump family protein
MSFLQSFKQRWGIGSNWNLVVILVVFAISGTLSLYLSKPILGFFKINKDQMNPFLFWPLRILIMFVSYYIVLISVGTILGQNKFFVAFAKKSFGRFWGK